MRTIRCIRRGRPPRLTLFPYTTLFRSVEAELAEERVAIADALARTVRGGRAEEQPHERLHLVRSEEHTSELQSLRHLVCRLLLEKKKTYTRERKTATPTHMSLLVVRTT